MKGKPIAILDSQDNVLCIGEIAGVSDPDWVQVEIVVSNGDYEIGKTYNFNKNNVRLSFNPTLFLATPKGGAAGGS